MKTTPQGQLSTDGTRLHMAMELSASTWKLAFVDVSGRKPRIRSVAAGDLKGLANEIKIAKGRFKLPEETPVSSCYEAGRDGFWIHRCLVSMGIDNYILDASSIEVNRRRRRAKTDRIDAEKLVRALVLYLSGDKYACRIVRVPAPNAEDERHLHRELRTLKTERTRHTNRIRSLLVTQGVSEVVINRKFPKNLESFKTGDQQELGAGLRERLLREFARLQMVTEQIRALEQQQAAMFRQAARDGAGATRQATIAHQLLLLDGIGTVSSWTLSAEVFSWRDIQNRRQLGALAGLVPTPYASGSEEREQGISGAGRAELRTLMIEIAWGWLQWQPKSALSRWFRRRFGDNKRSRKQGIVALARKLLVAFGKYVRDGELPAGATLKENELKFRYTPSLGAPPS